MFSEKSISYLRSGDINKNYALLKPKFNEVSLLNGFFSIIALCGGAESRSEADRVKKSATVRNLRSRCYSFCLKFVDKLIIL